MTTDGHVAYFTRTGNPTYTQEIITFQEKETLNDDGLFKDSEQKLQDDQSDKTWQFQDSKDMQISRNRWRFGTVLFISTTVLCLVVTIYFATSSSNKSKNTHGKSNAIKYYTRFILFVVLLIVHSFQPKYRRFPCSINKLITIDSYLQLVKFN